MSLMAPGMASGIGFTTANHSGIGTVQSGGSVDKAWEDEKKRVSTCRFVEGLEALARVVEDVVVCGGGDGGPYSMGDEKE